MTTVAFYDAKSYDREYCERAPEASRLRLKFYDFRLTSEIAASVDGAQAVCVFVNDRRRLVRYAARASTTLTSRPRRHWALRSRAVPGTPRAGTLLGEIVGP